MTTAGECPPAIPHLETGWDVAVTVFNSISPIPYLLGMLGVILLFDACGIIKKDKFFHHIREDAISFTKWAADSLYRMDTAAIVLTFALTILLSGPMNIFDELLHIREHLDGYRVIITTAGMTSTPTCAILSLWICSLDKISHR